MRKYKNFDLSIQVNNFSRSNQVNNFALSIQVNNVACKNSKLAKLRCLQIFLSHITVIK